VAYRDTPPGTTPGYYQTDPQHGAVGGPRLVGRKTGRVAPRDHIMQPAWEDTLQRHDLLPKHDSQVGPNSSFNPNQGQLFDPQVVAPRDTRSDREIARSLGAPTGEVLSNSGVQNPRLGAEPGFMPGLTTKQKIKAIENVGEARDVTGASRGGSPFAEMMEDRASHTGKRAAWYMGTDETGEHNRNVQGEAAKQIHQAAGRTGVSSSTMARAVAATSPQMGWKSEGRTDDPTAHTNERSAPTAGVHPNLAVAEDVVRTAKKHVAGGSQGDLYKKVDDRGKDMPVEDRDTEIAAGSVKYTSRVNGRSRMIPTQEVHPAALGGTTPGRHKAADVTVHELTKETSDIGPYPIQDIKSQKAANFDASLNLSHENKAVQRIASQSYTVDRHDGNSVGIDVESNQFKRRGTYEAVAMTGRRAALKNRQLPPNEQAMEWESHRASKGLGGGNQLFSAGTTVIRPELRPSEPSSGSRPGSRNMLRRDGSRIPDDITPF
jgi:hypothetical protein